ncbi:MAG: FecR family protein [Desulfocapsaceae bacterium]
MSVRKIQIKMVVLTVVLLLAASNSFGDEAAFIALVKKASGDVSVVRKDERIKVEPGTRLQQSDIIISGADSTVGVTFMDGTLLSIGPSSHVDLQQYVFEPIEEQYDFSLYLKKGQAVYSSGRIGKLAPEKVKVNTPRATLGIRGTRFIVNVD